MTSHGVEISIAGGGADEKDDSLTAQRGAFIKQNSASILPSIRIPSLSSQCKFPFLSMYFFRLHQQVRTGANLLTNYFSPPRTEARRTSRD